MLVETHGGSVNVAIAIPTRFRVEELAQTLHKMPFLVGTDTFIGVDEREYEAYAPVRKLFPSLVWETYLNEPPRVGFCRERLRRRIAANPAYDYVVLSDDIKRFDFTTFTNLVRCAVEFPKQPCTAHGFHESRSFYGSGTLDYPDFQTVNGIRSYEGNSCSPSAVNMQLYRTFFYPEDVDMGEDTYMTFWMLEHGYDSIRVCYDAPYSGRRHQPGGTHVADPNEKLIRAGLSTAVLAKAFPLFYGAAGVTGVAWKFVFALARGYRFRERPPGGSPRLHSDILAEMERWDGPVKVRPKPHTIIRRANRKRGRRAD